MGNHFTRNTRDVLDASKQRLDNMEQNDMISDSEDIYIHNHFELFPITKALLNVTSDDSIDVRQTAKNIRNVRVNEQWLSEKVEEYELPQLTESEVKSMVDNGSWLHDKVEEYVHDVPEINYPVTSVNGETGAVVIDMPEVDERIYVDVDSVYFGKPNWLDIDTEYSTVFYDSKGIYINVKTVVNDSFSDTNLGSFELAFPIDVDNLIEQREMYKVIDDIDLKIIHSNVVRIYKRGSSSGQCVCNFVKNPDFNENVSIGDSIYFNFYVARG